MINIVIDEEKTLKVESDNDLVKEELVIGALGDQTTNIKGNLGNADMKDANPIDISIDSNGVVHANSLESNEDIVVKGIDGKAVRVVKTYTDSYSDFTFGILTEDGSLYVATIGSGLNSDILSNSVMTFKKIDSDVKIYGISTTDYMNIRSLIVAYDKDSKIYTLEHPTCNSDDCEYILK